MTLGSIGFSRGAARSVVASCALLAASGAVVSGASEAHAAGLLVVDRGVRPLGRGGAFVAGADDLNAVVYNPAGIYDAGSQLLLDLSWVSLSADYTRQALVRQVDPNNGDTVATFNQTFPTVEASTPFLPIPTLVGSFSPHPDWMVAFGAYVPYAVLPSYPEKVGDAPAPQRYSLLSMDGSVLAVIGGWVAWAPLPTLRVGLGVDLMVGTFRTTKMMSGCLPERFFCSPEDPEWDVLAEIAAGPIVTPSGNLGVIWQFADNFRLGASFHLPFWIRAPATIKTRLPTTAVFDNSETIGEDATIAFALPFQARLGVEMRDLPEGLRVELASTYEHWTMHDEITVEIDDIAITNLPGFPKEYYLPDVELPRGLQGTVGVHLGGEWTFPLSESVKLAPRLGAKFETSSVPAEVQSVLLIDSMKVIPSVGASLHIGDARIDAVFAHVFAQTTNLDPKDARLEQTIPLSANPSKNPDYVNGGIYNWSVNVVGLGFAYTFDPAAQSKPAAKVDEEREPKNAPPDKEPEKKEPAPEPEEEAALDAPRSASGVALLF